MKSHFITILLLLVCFVCQGQNQIDRQGRKQGHWIKTDKDGSKIFEGNFKDGLEVGLFQYFYPDGKIRIENNFSQDGKYCSHKAYDKNGQLLATGFFSQKNRDSVWNIYTESGKLIKTTHYKMGVKQGVQVIYNSNGDTAEVSGWNNNRRHGYWWKRIGVKGYITGTYANGLLEGLLKEFNDEGQLIREGSYKNGEKDGSYKYFDKKLLVIDESWGRGFLQDRKILIMQPEVAYISVYQIACLIPKGKNQVVIYTKRGERIDTFEPADDLYNRIGNEIFSQANKKSRMMVATDCIVGLKKDAEGRDILDVEPAIDYDIFPDEDCIKMVESLQREGIDEK